MSYLDRNCVPSLLITPCDVLSYNSMSYLILSLCYIFSILTFLILTFCKKFPSLNMWHMFLPACLVRLVFALFSCLFYLVSWCRLCSCTTEFLMSCRDHRVKSNIRLKSALRNDQHKWLGLWHHENNFAPMSRGLGAAAPDDTII